MVLTKSELIGALQQEVQILLHLASKIEPTMLDYRPTPKQRSTIELLRYLSIMGPELVKATKRGSFDVESWTAASAAAEKRSFEETVAAIAAEKDFYKYEVGSMSDEEFRAEMDAFGRAKMSKGAFLVSLVLGGHAAYRTQLFMYLKACGREELTTMNLWAGMDAPAAAAV